MLDELEVVKIRLEKILFESRQTVDVGLSGMLFEVLPHAAHGLLISLRGYIWGQRIQNETVTLSVDVPATWWQHLKQTLYAWRRFPDWARRRWPVALRKVDKSYTFETVALLPGFKYEVPRGCGEAYVLQTNVSPRKWSST
jgi:hypothetical protein